MEYFVKGVTVLGKQRRGASTRKKGTAASGKGPKGNRVS